jgi:hypothetical protein
MDWSQVRILHGPPSFIGQSKACLQGVSSNITISAHSRTGRTTMKRDWDLIREVLLEVEALNPAQFETKQYGPLAKSDNAAKDIQAVMLWKAGFIAGASANYLSEGEEVTAQELTWSGHELLDTIRSKPVWEKIKSTAQEKGIELTYDTVIALGKAAVAWIISQTG